MNFRRFHRGFNIISFNFTQWRKGDLFILGYGYQVQTRNVGRDQYLQPYNPICWEFDDELQKYVLSWNDRTGQKVVSTSGELYEEELAYDQYVAQFYG